MDNDWAILGVRMVVHHVPDSPPELEQGVGERVRVARPLRVVEQDHFSLLVILFRQKNTFLCAAKMLNSHHSPTKEIIQKFLIR